MLLQRNNYQITELTRVPRCPHSFLATLVALHFTQVSNWLSRSVIVSDLRSLELASLFLQRPTWVERRYHLLKWNIEEKYILLDNFSESVTSLWHFSLRQLNLKKKNLIKNIFKMITIFCSSVSKCFVMTFLRRSTRFKRFS